LSGFVEAGTNIIEIVADLWGHASFLFVKYSDKSGCFNRWEQDPVIFGNAL
jgi:hypothetical protein